MRWLKWFANPDEISSVTPDGRTVVDANRLFETPEVKALIDAIRVRVEEKEARGRKHSRRRQTPGRLRRLSIADSSS